MGRGRSQVPGEAWPIEKKFINTPILKSMKGRIDSYGQRGDLRLL